MWKNLLFTLFLVLTIPFVGCKSEGDATNSGKNTSHNKEIFEFPRPTDPAPPSDLPEKHREIAREYSSRQWQRVLEWEFERDQRELLVSPRLAGFSPQERGPKIRISLIPKTKNIRAGGSFWYRLQVQNVSGETIRFTDEKGFLLSGDASFSKFHFFVTPPREEERRVFVRTAFKRGDGTPYEPKPFDIPGLEKAKSREQRLRIIEEFELRKELSHRISVRLLPGEILHSKSWENTANSGSIRPQIDRLPQKRMGNPGFREFFMDFEFKNPGTHEIRVEFADEKLPGYSQEILRGMEARGHDRRDILEDLKESNSSRFGIIKSEPVRIEVLK